MALTEEDVKNLTSWLQAILKETQEARASSAEVKEKVQAIAEIRDQLLHVSAGGTQSEHKIEEARQHIEGRLDKIEDILQDLRSQVQDIKSKLS